MPNDIIRRDIAVNEDRSARLEMYHEAVTPVTPLKSVTADVLEAILTSRLFLTIREELGASYSAGSSISQRMYPTQGYTSKVTATLNPSRFDEVHVTMLSILEDLTFKEVEPDDMTEAKSGCEHQLQHNQQLVFTEPARCQDDNGRRRSVYTCTPIKRTRKRDSCRCASASCSVVR